MLTVLFALDVDSCSVQEEPARGLDDAFEVVPGRRRELMDFELSLGSGGSEELMCLGDEDGLMLLPPGISSCLAMGGSGRPPVSLGSDIADWGGGRGIYLGDGARQDRRLKWRCREAELDDPELVVRQSTRS
jgi:hypothetical protein